MTIAQTRQLLTPPVLAILNRVARSGKTAFTPEALCNAGVPPEVVAMLVVDPRAHVPERARVSLDSRTRIPTTSYIWAPDVAAHLRGWS